MINLIPNEEKKKMSKDFYLRLVVVLFVMLGASLLTASFVILPSYFLSSAEKNSADAKLKSQESESISLPDQNMLMVVKSLKDKLNLIESIEKNKSTFSQKVINEIVLKKTPNIKITRIFYQNDPLAGKKIDISGRAPNREILLLFGRALQDNPVFSKVDLPVSNFVKGSDIKFHLTLIPS